jgi:hypothetical protein
MVAVENSFQDSVAVCQSHQLLGDENGAASNKMAS